MHQLTLPTPLLKQAKPAARSSWVRMLTEIGWLAASDRWKVKASDPAHQVRVRVPQGLSHGPGDHGRVIELGADGGELTEGRREVGLRGVQLRAQRVVLALQLAILRAQLTGGALKVGVIGPQQADPTSGDQQSGRQRDRPPMRPDRGLEKTRESGRWRVGPPGRGGSNRSLRALGARRDGRLGRGREGGHDFARSIMRSYFWPRRGHAP